MSKSRRLIILLLGLIIIGLVGWHINSQDEATQNVPHDDQSPTYTSQSTKTVVYNPQGGLAYQLKSNEVTYYENAQTSWFQTPILTTYDDQKRAAWTLKADKAKLTKNRMLYLYGHVEVNALIADSRLQRITTDNAQVNLITQDVTSNDQVTIYGHGFNSTGMKLRGNLRAKNAKLLEKVNTSYEIQTQS